MQASGQYQVVELPLLYNSILCPVQAIKTLIKTQKLSDKNGPLFQIMTKKGMVPLVAANTRSVLNLAVISLGLNPRHFTFHSFRPSGASLAFNGNVALENIKQHGNWRSEAVWLYLQNTLARASVIPTTFQQLLQ